MAQTAASLSFVLDEVTSAVMMNEFMELPNVFGSIYGMRLASGRRERHSSVSGLSQLADKNELAAAEEDAVIQQFQKDFVHGALAKQVPVSREVIRDEEWGWFQNLGVLFGDAANRTFETKAAQPFVNAFDTSTHTSEDSLALCGGAHVNVDGGNSQSNRGTAALALAGIDASREAMKGFTDYRGEKIGVRPSALIVPDELEREAWEFIRSELKPGVATNEKNFYEGLFELFVWGYLTDATDWFMVDQRLMSRNLLWYQREDLEVFGDGDLFTGTRRIGAYTRFSNGPVDWRFIFGQEVA